MPIIRILDLEVLVIIAFILVVSFNTVYALVASDNNSNSNTSNIGNVISSYNTAIATSLKKG